MAGLAMAALGEAALGEHLTQLLQHRRAAAHHDPVALDIQQRLADIVEQLSGSDQIGDAAAVAKRLSGDRWIVGELLGEQRSEQLVAGQTLYELLAIGEFRNLATSMDQNDLLELLVNVRILDQAREWRKPGA